MFLLLFPTIIVLFNSCKKEKVKPDPPCTTTCQNGGTVTPDCGCKCPSGYTGPNCQNLVYTNDMASLDPGIYYQLCPSWYSGDDDFGGCLTIDWRVQLVLSHNDTRIYAKIYARYKEYTSTGNTAAWIDPNLASSQKLLYTAPAGKKIHTIKSNYSYGGRINPPCDFYNTISYIDIGSNSFLSKINFIGDTSGPDLPCDGSTERSRFRIYFKSFGVTLVNQ